MRDVPWLALLSFVLGCNAGAGEPATEDLPINGGQIESGHPEVGIIQFEGSVCTGTLIADDLVLTAAHCVNGAAVAFHVGPSYATRTSYPAAAVTQPEGAWSGRCARFGDLDVAIVRLAERVPNIAPSAIGSTSAQVNDDVVTVGFGDHEEANGEVTWGTKRSAIESVDLVTSAAIVTRWKTGATAGGDSGGPLFHDGVLAGVTSCGAGEDENFYTRVSAAASWVADVMAGRIAVTENPPPSPTAADVSTPEATCARFVRVASGRTLENGALLSDAALRSRCLADVTSCAPQTAAWVTCVEARCARRLDTELCASRSGCGGGGF